MEIGRRMSGTGAAVAPAMITTRGGLLRKRKKNGTVIAALASGVLRLQPVEPVELGLAGEVIEIAPEKIESIASKAIDAPGIRGRAVLRRDDRQGDDGRLRRSFELSFLDGSGELFRDHTPEATRGDQLGIRRVHGLGSDRQTQTRERIAPWTPTNSNHSSDL